MRGAPEYPEYNLDVPSIDAGVKTLPSMGSSTMAMYNGSTGPPLAVSTKRRPPIRTAMTAATATATRVCVHPFKSSPSRPSPRQPEGPPTTLPRWIQTPRNRQKEPFNSGRQRESVKNALVCPNVQKADNTLAHSSSRAQQDWNEQSLTQHI